VTLIGGPRSILRFPTLSGPGEAEAFIAGRVAEGVDYIKVFIEDGSFWGRSRQVLSPESVHTVIAAAHRHGKQVLVHADGGASVRLALDAGADALAHHPNDADPAGDITGRLATGRRFVIPTLTIPAAFAPGRRGHEGGNDDLLGHPRLGPYLDARTRQIMTAPPPPPPPAAPKNFTRVGLDFTGVLDITGRLHRAGVPLLAGTDAIPVFGHGVGLHRELQLLMEVGLTPAEVLAAATSVPARCFGLADRGRISPGLRADLLLVDGDPTTGITATSAPSGAHVPDSTAKPTGRSWPAPNLDQKADDTKPGILRPPSAGASPPRAHHHWSSAHHRRGLRRLRPRRPGHVPADGLWRRHLPAHRRHHHRSVLLPSTMVLLGDRNWYLPAWLNGSHTSKSKATWQRSPSLARCKRVRDFAGRIASSGGRPRLSEPTAGDHPV
jgi:Amidohydrolase family